MQRLRTVTSLDVSAVAGHHAMPAALLLVVKKLRVLSLCPAGGKVCPYLNCTSDCPDMTEILLESI